MTVPPPPEAFERFTARFPGLAEGWEQLGKAGRDGPLDGRTIQLVKLAIALGSEREGPVHSAVRKAHGAGVPAEELEQVVALCASTLGLPATVKGYNWVRDILDG